MKRVIRGVDRRLGGGLSLGVRRRHRRPPSIVERDARPFRHVEGEGGAGSAGEAESRRRASRNRVPKRDELFLCPRSLLESAAPYRDPQPMDNLDRMYRHLVRTIRSRFPQYLTQPFDVGELHQTILPYRHHRRELGLETNEDYEIALTRAPVGRARLSDRRRPHARRAARGAGVDESRSERVQAVRDGDASRCRRRRCAASTIGPDEDVPSPARRRRRSDARRSSAPAAPPAAEPRAAPPPAPQPPRASTSGSVGDADRRRAGDHLATGRAAGWRAVPLVQRGAARRTRHHVLPALRPERHDDELSGVRIGARGRVEVLPDLRAPARTAGELGAAAVRPAAGISSGTTDRRPVAGARTVQMIHMSTTADIDCADCGRRTQRSRSPAR